MHRRSIVEMEKELQQPMELQKSKSLHNDVVKANAAGNSATAAKHLTVSIPAPNPVNGTCSPTPRLRTDNFDLKLVCPHGMDDWELENAARLPMRWSVVAARSSGD